MMEQPLPPPFLPWATLISYSGDSGGRVSRRAAGLPPVPSQGAGWPAGEAVRGTVRAHTRLSRQPRGREFQEPARRCLGFSLMPAHPQIPV